MERHMSLVEIHKNSVDSCLSNEEEAASLLRISSTSSAGHSVDSWTKSFLAPVHQRSLIGRILDEHDTEFDSEEPPRTWDDEQCFEGIMWSVKEISSEFSTASYEEQFNHCSQLSENWFQQDARHYDEQQKKPPPKEQMQLAKLEDLDDLLEKYVTRSFERIRNAGPDLDDLFEKYVMRSFERIRNAGPFHCKEEKDDEFSRSLFAVDQFLGLPSLKTSTLDVYLLQYLKQTWEADLRTQRARPNRLFSPKNRPSIDCQRHN